MANRIVIKQNDLLPIITATVKDEDDVVVDLTNASTISFSMRNQYTGTLKINAAAGAFVSKPAGTISYTWASGDTNTIGDYIAEFGIVWLTGNKPQTAPQATNLYISIVDGVI
ncbi:MAG TPA: hypothetical protein VI489_04840 [Candidatus Brocadiaceae bacterium]